MFGTNTAMFVIGMAGSGKSTLTKTLADYNEDVFTINLDPATKQDVPAPCIDIRDSIDYNRVRKDYQMGPNGAILTSLNLFATRIDELVETIKAQSEEDYTFVIDTPGQIEAFTWSAGGKVMMEAVPMAIPSVVAYVIDSPRCISPQAFASSILNACSLLYRTSLPVVLVFNKCDVAGAEHVVNYVNDLEAFSGEGIENLLRTCAAAALSEKKMPEQEPSDRPSQTGIDWQEKPKESS